MTDPDAALPADALGRSFTAAAPGTRLVGDITYLRTVQVWLYLATVIDLCSRMVVGWEIAENMRASLVRQAMRMAHDGGGYLAPKLCSSQTAAANTTPTNSRFAPQTCT